MGSRAPRRLIAPTHVAFDPMDFEIDLGSQLGLQRSALPRRGRCAVEAEYDVEPDLVDMFQAKPRPRFGSR